MDERDMERLGLGAFLAWGLGMGWDGYPLGVSVPKLSAFDGKGN
jgi:hypothetical protein